ncbi:MAG: ATP-binding protein [Intestinimonas sp.]|nr:ATP-binding protein [Intestinimonas sp.]
MDKNSFSPYKVCFDRSPVAFGILHIQAEAYTLDYGNQALSELIGHPAGSLSGAVLSGSENAFLNRLVLLCQRVDSSGVPGSDIGYSHCANRRLSIQCYPIQAGYCAVQLADAGSNDLVSETTDFTREIPRTHEVGLGAVIPGGISIHRLTSAEFVNIFSSEGVYRLMGYTSEDVPALPENKFPDMVHPDDRESFRRAVAEVCTRRGELHCEYRLRHRDGSWHWVSLIANPYIDQNGSVYYYGVYSDMDHRKKAAFQEKKAHGALSPRYEEEVRDIQALSDECLCILCLNLSSDLLEYFTGKTLSGQLYVGMTLKELRRRTAFAFPDETSRQRFADLLSPEHLERELACGNHHLNMVLPLSDSRGRFLWVEFRITLRRHPDTHDLIAFLAEKDISRKILMEDMLHQVVAQDYDFLLCIEAGSDSFFRFASKGSVFREDVPYSKSIKRYVCHFFPPKKQQEALRSLCLETVLQQLNSNPTYQRLYQLPSPEGRICYKLFRFAYLNQTRQTVLLTVRDISDIISREERSKQRITEALQAAKRANAAKSEFLSRMSHDIRTPMNAIIGMTALARDETDNPAVIADYLSKIEESSQFLLGLINDILDMSKIESKVLILYPEPYNLRDFVRQVKTLFRPLCAQKQITFSITARDIGWVLLDKLRFNQIFFNLLSNAVKFTPDGGQITFSILPMPAHGERLRKRFFIRDTGIGMSPEFQSHMFEPFTQENASGVTGTSGTGLGLAIVKNLVELMEGTIQVDSVPGRGTGFTVELDLPPCPPPSRQPETERANCSRYDGILSGKRVLLCEDHPLNIQVATRLLEKKGVLVTCARDGQEGVRQFYAAPPHWFNVILMDIRMPVMDGIEATRFIRSMDRPDAHTIPIIAMTANAFRQDRDQTRAAGMNTHLAKPIKPALLYQTLAEFL